MFQNYLKTRGNLCPAFGIFWFTFHCELFRDLGFRRLERNSCFAAAVIPLSSSFRRSLTASGNLIYIAFMVIKTKRVQLTHLKRMKQVTFEINDSLIYKLCIILGKMLSAGAVFQIIEQSKSRIRFVIYIMT